MKTLKKIYQNAVGGAILMGLIWAFGLGLSVGGFMEAFIDPRGEILDMWPQTIGIPGFLGGIIFFILLRISKGRRHKLSELNLLRVGSLGAVSGLIVSLIFSNIIPVFWQYATLLISLSIILSSIAAVTIVLLFRYAEQKQSTEKTSPES